MTDTHPMQRQRAIRRAVESVAHIARPADWTPADYARFEKTLAANGFVVAAKAEEDPSDG
jgi:hypothetical protein